MPKKPSYSLVLKNKNRPFSRKKGRLPKNNDEVLQDRSQD